MYLGDSSHRRCKTVHTVRLVNAARIGDELDCKALGVVVDAILRLIHYRSVEVIGIVEADCLASHIVGAEAVERVEVLTGVCVIVE